MEKRYQGDSIQVVQLLGKPLIGSGGAGTDRSITASTTSQVLMVANANRMRFYIANDTAINVYVRPAATATAAAGSGNVKVAANGGFFELAGDADAWAIIAESGSPAITAREF